MISKSSSLRISYIDYNDRVNYKFAPAMISERISKYYDLFVGAIFVGKRLQRKTLLLLELDAATSFVDIGCGTGTLVIMAKQTNPHAQVTGLDPGNSVLAIAKSKATKSNVDVTFVLSGAEKLPFQDRSIDRIASSLAFHHMPTEIKKQALMEIHRVLAEDGLFILVDIGKPKNLLWKVLLKLEALIEPKEYIRDNMEGKIPDLVKGAGFSVDMARVPYMGIHFLRCKKIC